MYRFFILFAVLWAGLTTVAVAAEPVPNGFFVGGSVGVSELDDDDLFRDYGLNIDDSDTAFGVFGGYKFTRYFAVEARYTDFGTFEAGDGWVYEDINVDAISAHAVGIIPFGMSGWSIYGQVGLGAVSIDCSFCSDETALSLGIGVSYNATENLAVAFQSDAYGWEETDSYGDDYDIIVSSAQIVVRYTF